MSDPTIRRTVYVGLSCVLPAICTGKSGGGEIPFLISDGIHAGAFPLRLIAGDFNRDGIIDFGVANRIAFGSIHLVVSTGRGVYETRMIDQRNDPAVDLVFGDLDRDGDLDIAATYSQWPGHSPGVIRTLLNRGDAEFDLAAEYPLGSAGGRLAAADLDRDGDLDLISTSEAGLVILENNGDASFNIQPPFGAVFWDGGNIAAFDADTDGDLDLLAGSFEASLYLNDGTGTFTASDAWAVNLTSESFTIGDVNNDGADDIVETQISENRVRIWFGAGDGTFAVQPGGLVGVGEHPERVSLGDVDADGDLDLATANYLGFDVTIRFNNGDGTFGLSQTIEVEPIPESAIFVDVDNDGDLDLAVSEVSTSEISLLINQTIVYEPCNLADFAEPFGVLDVQDIAQFIGFTVLGDPQADVAAPIGVLDLSDLVAFIEAFNDGCDSVTPD